MNLKEPTFPEVSAAKTSLVSVFLVETAWTHIQAPPLLWCFPAFAASALKSTVTLLFRSRIPSLKAGLRMNKRLAKTFSFWVPSAFDPEFLTTLRW